MPRPVRTLGPISLKFKSNENLGLLNICGKFEVNRLKRDGVMKGHLCEKETRKNKE